MNAGLPAIAKFGLRVVSTGTPLGACTLNGSAFDVPPPGVGLNTVTLAVVATVKSEAGIVADSCVELTNCVARSAPFHLTIELGVNPPPVTTSVTAGPFIGDTFGVRRVIAGAGLLIVNVSAPLVPPDGSGLKIV